MERKGRGSKGKFSMHGCNYEAADGGEVCCFGARRRRWRWSDLTRARGKVFGAQSVAEGLAGESEPRLVRRNEGGIDC